MKILNHLSDEIKDGMNLELYYQWSTLLFHLSCA